jgi:hypothetical protein
MQTIYLVSLQTGYGETVSHKSIAAFTDSSNAFAVCDEYNKKFAELKNEVHMEVCGVMVTVEPGSELWVKDLQLL